MAWVHNCDKWACWAQHLLTVCVVMHSHSCCPAEAGFLRLLTASAGKPTVVQLMNYKKNGDPFINYLSITPIHDSNGHITHFVGIQSDISDLVNHKKAELNAKHEAAQVSCARLMPDNLILGTWRVRTLRYCVHMCTYPQASETGGCATRSHTLTCCVHSDVCAQSHAAFCASTEGDELRWVAEYHM